MKILKIEQVDQKLKIAKEILEMLPEWFGSAEAVNDYILNINKLDFWSALTDENIIAGFIALKIHYDTTGDIYVFAVNKSFQNKGYGKALLITAENHCINLNCKRIIIKTLDEKVKYQPYLETLNFYIHMGYEKMISFTEFWDKDNPCLMLIKEI